MNDKELLELAAKAFQSNNPSWVNNWAFQKGFMQNWNPLTDDGDALRLAVKLRMDVTIGVNVKAVACLSIGEDDSICEKWVEAGGDDMGAVTRRAIVCAAAKVGEQMP